MPAKQYVTWGAMAVVAVVAMWAWGVGFWMASHFVSRDDFDKRTKIEHVK